MRVDLRNLLIDTKIIFIPSEEGKCEPEFCHPFPYSEQHRLRNTYCYKIGKLSKGVACFLKKDQSGSDTDHHHQTYHQGRLYLWGKGTIPAFQRREDPCDVRKSKIQLFQGGPVYVWLTSTNPLSE